MSQAAKSDRPTIHEINCTTGNRVERPMTDEEYAQYLSDLEAVTNE